jgi:hypothetical protein
MSSDLAQVTLPTKDNSRVPEKDLHGPRIGSDLLELIAWLQDSLADAWREIHDLHSKVTALSPAPEPLTVEQMVQRHPALSPGGIRWMLFHRETNGLERSGAVITRGRRLYLDETRFLEWFASTGKPRTRGRAGQRGI